MKNHKDLIHVLKSHGMKITPTRSLILQYIIDNHHKEILLNEIYEYLNEKFISTDKSSVYRNIEILKQLDIIYEINSSNNQKAYKYVFDTKLHPFFICKSCSKIVNIKENTFKKFEEKFMEFLVEQNLSAIFYGYCDSCKKEKI